MTDINWFNKVELLLAKAASTEFPDEAEALMAKAQNLMSVHAIDEAMLQAAGKTRDDVMNITVTLVNPYLNQKHSLLTQIAKANSVRAIMTSKPKGSRGATIVLFGFESDIQSVQTMFASLSAYAVADMLRQKVPAGQSARGYRVSYLLGFAGRIGERLAETSRAARIEAEASYGGSNNVSVVLADKKKEVDDAFNQMFPHIVKQRAPSYSSAGRNAGRSAANNAGINKGVGKGSQRALAS